MTSKKHPLITGKNIFVISPQRWGKMYVSKHHYAIELARLGNHVFFLNPPISDLKKSVEIRQLGTIKNLSIVSYRLCFPYKTRFHLKWLFDYLMRLQMCTVLKKINVSFDIVWCFDTNLFSNLRIFGAKKIIYHLADQIMSEAGIKAASTADLLISVDQALLDKVSSIKVPKEVVGHGLAESFALQAKKRLAKHDFPQSGSTLIQVGYVGNLLISSLDRATFKRIIVENKDVIFHFWGSTSANENNIGNHDSPEVSSFISFLNISSNVILHGVTTSEKLAEEIQLMDVFLLCYDICIDINGGCNSHKILEYLSTGKVIVSSPMSSYANLGNLIRMCRKTNNSDLPELFSITIKNIAEYNTLTEQHNRIQFALNSRYQLIIKKILTIV